jgi:hypothetical protein
VRIYKTKWMARFTRRERIGDDDLVEAVRRVERGLIDADLGGGLIKQRIARAGQGRSGGYRMVLVFKAAQRVVFLYGFAKSERENIEDDELQTLREIGASWLAASAQRIAKALQENVLHEVTDDEESST